MNNVDISKIGIIGLTATELFVSAYCAEVPGVSEKNLDTYFESYNDNVKKSVCFSISNHPDDPPSFSSTATTINNYTASEIVGTTSRTTTTTTL